MDRIHRFLLLREQHRRFVLGLYTERYLNERHVQLRLMVDENHPKFLSELYSLFFRDCVPKLANLAASLDPPSSVVDWELVKIFANLLKDACVNVGATRMIYHCTYLGVFVDQKNLRGCWHCLINLQLEYQQLKARMQHLFRVKSWIPVEKEKVPE